MGMLPHVPGIAQAPREAAPGRDWGLLPRAGVMTTPLLGCVARMGLEPMTFGL
jgi:hypothetical protein